MDTKKLLIQTAYISLIVQLITGGIGSVGLFLELKPEDRILKDILRLETIVQFIEFIFYYWLVNNLSNIPENVTLIRYIDWNITTPLMLVSTAMFMKYNTMKENEKKIRKNTRVIVNSKSTAGSIASKAIYLIALGWLIWIIFRHKASYVVLSVLLFTLKFIIENQVTISLIILLSVCIYYGIMYKDEVADVAGDIVDRIPGKKKVDKKRKK